MSIDTRLLQADELSIRLEIVKDVIVFDPRSLLVLHVRQGQVTRQIAPQEIRLRCGCVVTV